ncbi:transmembrane protein 19 [Amyelois transitella]|uniref:transmembrane protein 19 n=1 Tax=Amyelois transitella TaxID=680683 RepID=UPI00067C250D|nr:transmembrane protein 19 [Amyelois transitella]
MITQQNNEETKKKKYLKDDHILTVALCAISIPLSMSLWIANIVYSKFILQSEGLDEPIVISPARWLASCLIPLSITVIGYRKKSLNFSGAMLGFFVGFILTLSNYCFLAVLFTFFISSSKATKLRPHLKRKFDPDFKEGGQRNWIQVLCNGGMAAQLGLLYLLDVGASERPIDFVKDYRASWLSLGILGVFSCCNGDTWASELGTVISSSEPYLVTSWKKVPKGTNGGISAVGTLFSAIGGFVIGLSYYISVLYFTDSAMWANAPPQWPLIVYGTLAGFIGSLIDSFMGALLQYSGLDKDGKIVSHSQLSVKHISGRNILDNHSVNLICTVIMGLLTPTISRYLWPVY